MYILGVYWDNGKENATYCCIFWGYFGIMAKKMQPTVVYSGSILGEWKRKWNLLLYIGGYIGIMEKKMQPTVVYSGGILGLWKRKRKLLLYILRVFWDNGKENATYCCIFWWYIGIMEKKMEPTVVYSGGILGYWKRKWKLLLYIGVYIGIMERKRKLLLYILGVFWDNGKENATYCCIFWEYIGIMEKKMEPTIVYWGVYWDNGEENGTYCCILGCILG